MQKKRIAKWPEAKVSQQKQNLCGYFSSCRRTGSGKNGLKPLTIQEEQFHHLFYDWLNILATPVHSWLIVLSVNILLRITDTVVRVGLCCRGLGLETRCIFLSQEKNGINFIARLNSKHDYFLIPVVSRLWFWLTQVVKNTIQLYLYSMFKRQKKKFSQSSVQVKKQNFNRDLNTCRGGLFHSFGTPTAKERPQRIFNMDFGATRSDLCGGSRADLGKVRPVGSIRPFQHPCPACECNPK